MSSIQQEDTSHVRSTLGFLIFVASPLASARDAHGAKNDVPAAGCATTTGGLQPSGTDQGITRADLNRDGYRSAMQANVDALDRELAELDDRAAHTAGATKTQLLKALLPLRAKRNAFEADFRSMETSTDGAFDSARTRLDKEWGELTAEMDEMR